MHQENHIRFLADHAAEFLPSAQDQELLLTIESSLPESGVVADNERVQRAIEHLETRVFQLEKTESEYDPGARRILLTASETLAFRSIEPIISAMRQDRRVKSIGLLTDNLAATLFEGRLEDFQQLRQPNQPMMQDALSMAEKEPFDVALVPVDPKNSPNALALFGAKSAFGTKKTFFLSTGWVGVGSSPLFTPDSRSTMEDLDGVFVADTLAAEIIRHQLPDLSSDKIHITGTPAIDAIEREHATEFAQQGREKLRIDEQDIAVLLLGFVSPSKDQGSYMDVEISEKTHRQTLLAIAEAARQRPDQVFTVLVRPHPTDPHAQTLLDMSVGEWPENMHFRNATNDIVTMQEAAYAADITASIVGTDTFLAPERGRTGLFLSYAESGMGQDVLDQLYGQDIRNIIRDRKGLHVAGSAEDVTHFLEQYQGTTRPEVESSTKGTSVEKMLNILLG